MFINFSVASADEVEIFGSEFEEIENTPAQTEQQEVEEPFQQESSTPSQSEQVEVTQPATQENSATANTETQAQTEVVEVSDDDELGDVLNFDDLSKARTQTPSTETDQPTVEVIEPETPTEIIKVTPATKTETTRPSTQSRTTTANSTSKNEKQQKLKLQKARFVKVTMDKKYIYYLDRDTVTWRKMPYSTTEMMADFWIRMIDRDDNELLADYEIDDVILAAEDGKQFRPEDLEVLRHAKYHLEHYYLRPKTQQIQYLSELSDIEGNPQNTINERTFTYSNWENLVPDSVESRIYRGVIKIIGKGKSQDSPVTFADYVEEYARISIR